GGAFFLPLQLFNDALVRHSKQEEERCVSQARSSGSTTQKVTDSSSATEAVTCSCTTRPFRATGSARSRKARRSSSRSLTVPRAPRPPPSPRSGTLQGRELEEGNLFGISALCDTQPSRFLPFQLRPLLLCLCCLCLCCLCLSGSAFLPFHLASFHFVSLTPFRARAVKLTLPSLTATRNATSGEPF